MSTFASTSTYSFATKDAAAKEREDRLLAAKKKLKLYRARTSQRLGSTSSAVTDASASPVRPTRRQSGLTSSISSQADFAAKHAHRRSQSKSGLLAAMGGDAFVGAGAGGPGHARRMSKGNRASRSSISLKKGHGHNRSRASISMSFSGPAPLLNPPPPSEPERSVTPTPRHPSNLGAPSSWQQNGAFPSRSPDLARPSSMNRSPSPLPPAPSPGPHPPAKHGRHGSRHARHSSVSNFRESLDLVGAGHADPAHTLLRPAVSSFAATAASDGTASPLASSSPRPLASFHASSTAATSGWSATNDPQQVLAALKERGRREVDDPHLSPEQTRQFALEALEGRVSAPSEMISLGNEEPGELLVAPKSPGFLTGAGGNGGFVASPLPPNTGFNSSPMIGLGVSGSSSAMGGGSGPLGAGGKRSSWGPLGGVAGVGAQGVMELGGIAEEDEEEEEEYVRRTGKSPVSSPKRGSPSPRKGRPASLFVEPRRGIEAVVAASANSTPIRSTNASPSSSPTTARRSSMRPLSLSLSSSASSSGGTPSTVAGPFGRRESLAAPSSPEDVRAPSSPGEKRHISMFHSAAAMGLDPAASAAATQSAFSSSSSANASGAAPIAQRGGLKSLSIGGGHSPSSLAEKRFSARSASVTATGPHYVANPLLAASAPASSSAPRRLSGVATATPPSQKRSSISYLTSSSTTPSGSSSPEHQKRAWLSSLSGAAPSAKDASPAVSTSHYSSFPLGTVGGFGDLEIDGETSSAQPSPSRLSFGLSASATTTGRTSPSHRSIASAASNASAATAAAAAAAEEISSLRSQVSSLEARNAQLASTHALEIAEFEKKASDEALEMRSRIATLESSVEEERVARRFEVEGLQREAGMQREAMEDLTEERDSLREDVDGWRSRCASLEAQVKKEREDDALAQAQAKLIGEMRDQIYSLVAALERERGEHAETRREVERMLEERVREAAADVESLGPNGRPDDLALIMEEEDDEEDVAPEEFEEDFREHHQQQQLQPAPGRHQHPYKTASGGSMLSTGSSTFSRSFSGNTTEDTSIMMSDLDDSFSTKLSSPPSGHSSFSVVVGGAFPPPASANPNRNSVRDADAVAAALGQLDTLAEEDEEDEEALVGGGGATPAAQYQPQQQPQFVEEPGRFSSESTTSTSSDVMPRTPERSQADHNRSHSFVRHWSFPRGSVTSARPSMEDDDQSFFGYNKHDSLPPLPIGDHVLPPFLTSTLDIDENHFSFFPPQPIEGTVEVAGHVRRPSSPRPLKRMSNPHLRRISGQYGKAPPPSPSALVSVALQHQQQGSLPPHHQAYGSAASSASSNISPSKSTSRYSFGALIGSALGGWSPSSSASMPAQSVPPPPAHSKLAFSAGPLVEADEDEDASGEGVEEDVFIATHNPPAPPPARPQVQAQSQPPRPHQQSHGTPVQLQHQTQKRLRYIAKHEVPTPKAGKLSQLNFSNSICCLDLPVFVV
ncbi:hypothetical protein JCM11251_001178 [Rhodosporidiobolus azoricus]